jgi:aspartyl/glutamyl-tRNA(Asn/Gln) amidotransferase C subunit
VRSLAKLAHLQLTDARAQELQHELSSVLESMRILQTLDLANLAPLTHVSQAINVLRDDVPQPALPAGTASSLPQGSLSHREDLAGFVHVPKVLGGSEGSA